MVETMARAFRWYGYKKTAVMCPRQDKPIAVRKVYQVMKEAGLLHRLKKRVEERARQEVARLYRLLPKRRNELWQTNVSCVPVAGYGWWYAITAIDHYSRYLLALHFTHSYSALEASRAFGSAVEEARRLHGPLEKPVFLVADNGPSFIAQRFRDALTSIQIAATGLSAFSQVRIGYRMSAPLGLVASFHETLKAGEVYWNPYADPWDARQELEIFRERHNQVGPHRGPAPTAPASVLTPHEVYAYSCEVDPPKWSPRRAWLQKEQENSVQPPTESTSEFPLETHVRTKPTGSTAGLYT